MKTSRPIALHVPLELTADQLALRVGSMREPALLESGPGFGDSGRWSILAARPRSRFVAFGNHFLIGSDGSCHGQGSGPLDALGRWLTDLGMDEATGASDPDVPPFQGGLIGFFGYDLAPRMERLPRKAPVSSRIPDIDFGLYDTAVTIDHSKGTATLSSYDLFDEGEAGLRGRVDGWLTDLNRPALGPPRTDLEGSIISNFSRADYLDAVARASEYIAAGDVFQINLSQRFSARGRIGPLDLYLRLRRRSPAPFSAYLQRDDKAIIGASPESFYQTRGRHIITRPIKGTRPRGSSPEGDARLRSELANSAKDRAELTMIVDLERNDLGRVCEFGSVRVTDPLSVESFAQVHHLVAAIEGRLRRGVGPIDVVRAMFPGGSITGAPKIRAMEIIDELEPCRRGPYTGAIGYFSRGGTSAFNIAIRTMVAEGDTVSYHVGGGIVADSDPEAEYEETLHKGRGLREVLEGWGVES